MFFVPEKMVLMCSSRAAGVVDWMGGIVLSSVARFSGCLCRGACHAGRSRRNITLLTFLLRAPSRRVLQKAAEACTGLARGDLAAGGHQDGKQEGRAERRAERRACPGTVSAERGRRGPRRRRPGQVQLGRMALPTTMSAVLVSVGGEGGGKRGVRCVFCLGCRAACVF